MGARANDVSNCGDRAAEGLRLGHGVLRPLPAFSLFEMVMVVAIISAVSAIAIPPPAHADQARKTKPPITSGATTCVK